jgi:hypothetical protein
MRSDFAGKISDFVGKIRGRLREDEKKKAIATNSLQWLRKIIIFL